jgi:hypothetical protein
MPLYFLETAMKLFKYCVSVLWVAMLIGSSQTYFGAMEQSSLFGGSLGDTCVSVNCKNCKKNTCTVQVVYGGSQCISAGGVDGCGINPSLHNECQTFSFGGSCSAAPGGVNTACGGYYTAPACTAVLDENMAVISCTQNPCVLIPPNTGGLAPADCTSCTL